MKWIKNKIIKNRKWKIKKVVLALTFFYSLIFKLSKVFKEEFSMKRVLGILVMVFVFFACSSDDGGEDNEPNNQQPISSSEHNYPPPQSSSSITVTPSSSSGGTKCGGIEYNTSTQFCLNNTIYSKCGGLTYNPLTQGCNINVIVEKCGTNVNLYNPDTHFCVGNTIYEKCGGKNYTPTTQECKDNIIFTSFTDSRDNQKYKSVVIGTQTWMAQNLNYNANGSECPDENNANCTTYGRQYNWATAMGLTDSYNSTAFNSTAKRQGVCPTGWHLPSEAEWNTLETTVGANSGTKLKAKSGWGTNGTDILGFGALPAGYIEYGILNDVAKYFGTGAIWWTNGEYNASYAYDRAITGATISKLGFENYNYSLPKNNMLSVRCVKD